MVDKREDLDIRCLKWVIELPDLGFRMLSLNDCGLKQSIKPLNLGCLRALFVLSHMRVDWTTI